MSVDASTTRLLADTSLDPVFTAVVDATEEAVTNALFVADTVTGVHGHVVPGSRSTVCSS